MGDRNHIIMSVVLIAYKLEQGNTFFMFTSPYMDLLLLFGGK